MAQAFGQLTAETGAQADTDINHLSLDGKTLRGSKDADGKAEHVLSAFCVALDQSVGPVSSRGKGTGQFSKNCCGLWPGSGSPLFCWSGTSRCPCGRVADALEHSTCGACQREDVLRGVIKAIGTAILTRGLRPCLGASP